MASWSLLILLISTLVSLSHSSDPDPLQDFCVAIPNQKSSPSMNGFPCKPESEVVSDDFFSKALSQEGNTSNPFGSNVTAANVLRFPGLNTLGLSMNRVDLAINGLNPPHVHPRATETGVIMKGKVLVGFISTANRYFAKNLSEGEMFVIPRGLVHFQMNVGAGKAKIITAFNSQLPGAVIVSTTLFGSDPPVNDDVLEKAFHVDKGVVDAIKSKF